MVIFKGNEMIRFTVIACVLLFVTNFSIATASNDIVIADFEGADYAGWQSTGACFGEGPVKGSLSSKHGVAGFKGNKLVDTYVDSKGSFTDGNTGTLTSPEFQIQRDYITFLVGGGGHENTCIQLLVEDKVAASCSGVDDEKLEVKFFDVRKHKGKTVRLKITDNNKGGWGHINIDQIVQADEKPLQPDYLKRQKEMKLTKQYILFPIQNGAKKAQVDIIIDGVDVRQFDAEIAVSLDSISFWAYLDITEFNSKVALLRVNGVTQNGLSMIVQSDKIPGSKDFYKELLRPQFHFSQKIGWINDPNGMVYYNGLWHLYFQHNPYGWNWGNMHWGHAVSKDLVHWEQLPIAIYNYKRGDWAYSGGATVDEKNTAGWQTGQYKTIVASWTSTGRGECISYSNDGGTTFTEYEGNPVVKHQGRDPKIIWYEPGQHWVMAVYDESDIVDSKKIRKISIYNSKDLKNWELKSKIPDYYECAEIFELPVDGDKSNTRWIIFAADAKYAMGKFDGQTFTPDHKGKHQVHYGKYYASQLFSNAPDNRKIQIGWARIDMPGMPFNQTFSFPHELTLRTTDDGIRMFTEPVKEIKKIYKKTHTVNNKKITEDIPVKVDISGDIFDVTATFKLLDAKVVGLDIGGNRIEYKVDEGKLQDASLEAIDGKITIRVLIDRPMMEIVGNDGRVYITDERAIKGDVGSIKVFTQGGKAKLLKLEINELNSIWD